MKTPGFAERAARCAGLFASVAERNAARAETQAPRPPRFDASKAPLPPEDRD